MPRQPFGPRFRPPEFGGTGYAGLSWVEWTGRIRGALNIAFAERIGQAPRTGKKGAQRLIGGAERRPGAVCGVHGDGHDLVPPPPCLCAGRTLPLPGLPAAGAQTSDPAILAPPLAGVNYHTEAASSGCVSQIWETWLRQLWHGVRGGGQGRELSHCLTSVKGTIVKQPFLVKQTSHGAAMENG